MLVPFLMRSNTNTHVLHSENPPLTCASISSKAKASESTSVSECNSASVSAVVCTSVSSAFTVNEAGLKRHSQTSKQHASHRACISLLACCARSLSFSLVVCVRSVSRCLSSLVTPRFRRQQYCVHTAKALDNARCQRG